MDDLSPREVILQFFYLHQVGHFTDHTQNLWGSFYLNGSVYLAQTQCLNSPLLTLRPVDYAFYLCDFNLFHILNPGGF